MRPRVLFFVGFCLVAAPGRFYSLFLEQYGLKESEIGTAIAIPSLIRVFVPMMWGVLADRWLGKHAVMCLSAVLNALVFGLFLWIPTAEDQHDGAHLETVVLLVTLSNLANAGFIPILDAACLDYLKARPQTSDSLDATPEELEAERKSFYGQERLWGGIGWAFCHMVLGVLYEQNVYHKYQVSILALFVLTVVWCLLVVYDNYDNQQYVQLTVQPIDSTDAAVAVEEEDVEADDLVKNNESSEKQQTSIEMAKMEIELVKVLDSQPSAGGVLLNFLKSLVLDPYNCVYVIVLIIASMGQALVEQLIFLFFGDTMHASNVIMGASVMVTVAFECPIFWVAPTLMKKLGPPVLFSSALVAYSIRTLIYTIITPDTLYLLLLVEPLHGVTYGGIQLASIHFFTRLAPKNYEATAQGTLQAARTIGMAGGTYFGSYAMEKYGSQVVYRVASGTVAIALIVYIVTYLKFGPPTSKTSQLTMMKK